MKPTTLAALALILAPALAHADQHLTCQYSAPRLDIAILNTSLFVPTDVVHVEDYEATVVKPFLEANETSLAISSAALNVNLDPGACVIDANNPNVIATCHRDAAHAPRLDRSEIQYTATTKSASGTEEQITVTRRLEVLSAELALTLVDGKSDLDGTPSHRVHSDLTVVAKVAGEMRTLHLTRDEGEWTSRTDRSNFDRCIVTESAR